jgi:hypothetical protein
MIKDKKLTIIVVAIAVVLVALLLWGNNSKPKQPVTNTANQSVKAKIYSTNGKVLSAASGNFTVLLKDNKTNLIILTNNDTRFIKRVSAKSGGYTDVNAKVSDIKIGSQIAVYSSNPIGVVRVSASSVELIK